MHTTRKALLLLLLLTSFALLTSCSGGGGGNGNSSNITLTPTSTTGGSGATVQVQSVNLALNASTGVTAKFVDSGNLPLSGLAVTFSTTLGTLTPVDGKVVTDATGTATVQLQAGSVSGPGQITATATVNNKPVVQSASFTVSLPTLTLSPISLGLSTISYGGSTGVSVTVKDANGNPFTAQNVDVTFISVQCSNGKATLNSPVRTVNGVATTTYKALTVNGSDTITASISGSTVTASLAINPLAASAISFVSSSPANIGLKGMGGAGIQETSTVTFKVLDVLGQTSANQQVDFTLNTHIGGIALNATSGSTASDGTVSTIVQAGIISTSVRVTATLRGVTPVIATQSDQLVVSTGVPAQDGFSIAIETLNPEAFNIDGIQDKVTARLSDHFHNPVPNGTAVYFTTSGGSIQPSCTTTGGACTVTWTSQIPRPVGDTRVSQNNGRAVILAYAVGEEAFIDLNGNGVADAGEFTDTSEAFRDDNENGVLDTYETFIDFNSDGIFNGPDGKYNGVLQGAAYLGAPKSKHIYSNSTLVMATSSAKILNSCDPAGSGITVGLGSVKSCKITVSDRNGNTMPLGTTVAFSYQSVISGITLTSDTFVFPNSTASVGTVLGIFLTDAGAVTTPPAPPTPPGRGALKVSVTSPGGLVTTGIYSVN